MHKILDESVQSLHEVCQSVETPIKIEDKQFALSLFEHVVKSQDEKYAKENNIRSAVGLASPQVGVNKRMFAINYVADNETKKMIIINPKILSHNKELIYLNGGEGCLSVNRETTGVVPRYSKITIEGLIYDFNTSNFVKKKMVLKDYFAIVFQHEYDHLDGILYVDKILVEEEAINKGVFSLWEL